MRLITEVAGIKSVDGDSYVGNVYSNRGQPHLNRSNGNANGNYGVFFRTRWIYDRKPCFGRAFIVLT